mgnify:CR=1 FL=1
MNTGRIERCRGFTLVESLLAIVIISTMVVAVAEILLSGMGSFSLITDRREALQGARLAVNMMTDEIQSISDPATDITAISANSITFTPGGGGGPVTYSISGANLTRNTKTLATSVTPTSGFEYFTANGAATTNPAQVYRVGVSVGVSAASAAHGQVVIKSSAYLRNRYYNGYTQM